MGPAADARAWMHGSNGTSMMALYKLFFQKKLVTILMVTVFVIVMAIDRVRITVTVRLMIAILLEFRFEMLIMWVHEFEVTD